MRKGAGLAGSGGGGLVGGVGNAFGSAGVFGLMLKGIKELGTTTKQMFRYSPSMLGSMKMLETSFYLLMKPIGDFIGAILRPIMSWILRFVIWLYKNPFFKDLLVAIGALVLAAKAWDIIKTTLTGIGAVLGMGGTAGGAAGGAAAGGALASLTSAASAAAAGLGNIVSIIGSGSMAAGAGILALGFAGLIAIAKIMDDAYKALKTSSIELLGRELNLTVESATKIFEQAYRDLNTYTTSAVTAYGDAWTKGATLFEKELLQRAQGKGSYGVYNPEENFMTLYDASGDVANGLAYNLLPAVKDAADALNFRFTDAFATKNYQYDFGAPGGASGGFGGNGIEMEIATTAANISNWWNDAGREVEISGYKVKQFGTMIDTASAAAWKFGKDCSATIQYMWSGGQRGSKTSASSTSAAAAADRAAGGSGSGWRKYMQSGGFIGSEGMYYLHAGETVMPAYRGTTNNFSGGQTTVNATVRSEADIDALARKIAQYDYQRTHRF